MKNLLSILTVLTLLFFTSCDDDNSDITNNPKEQKLTRMTIINDVGNTDNFDFIYGDNSYISKIIHIDGNYKSEYIYTYYNENQLIKEEAFYTKGNKPLPTTSEIVKTYKYTKEGLISSQTYYKNGKHQDTTITTYKCNKKGFVVQRIRDEKYVEIFDYSSDGNLIKTYVKGLEDISNTANFKYDNKKSPLNDIFPQAYSNIFIIQDKLGIFSKNNLIEYTFVYNDTDYLLNYKTITEYTYNEDDYPTKAVIRTYTGENYDETIIVKYLYE